MSDRPRILLVPTFTEVEWVIRSLLQEWADVATYDAPGVGDEPPAGEFGMSAVGLRGLAEADRRGWEQFVVVADEFAVVAASHIAVAGGARVLGLALGHARLSNAADGPRPAINREVLSGIQNLIRTDNRMYVQQLFKGTRGEARAGGYQDDLVDEYVRRVPLALTRQLFDMYIEHGEGLGERLLGLNAPMLLAQHKECLMFTKEGFEDAAAALPHARITGYYDKPSTSPEFCADLREFCTSLAAARA